MFSWMKDKRIVISFVFLVTLAISFWAGSRVPQLNEKAAMGTEVSITTLGFDTVFEIRPEQSTVTQILYTTVNWVDTNKKGMTFGVLFAAALMTLFSLVKRRSFKSSFANSALGIAVGTPLGVCVNCAAPIAAGMAAAGARLETTLATMISSPTMNVIVLTILFSLFPFYLVAIKVGFTLFFIIFMIPFMARFILKKEVKESMEKGVSCDIGSTTCDISDMVDDSAHIASSWWGSLKWMIVNYLKNFWFVFKTTVPLMALAGLLGSIAITLLPFESLANLVPQDNQLMVLFGMLIVAAIGLFLPVPISFDVIICAILFAAGMPVKYVMVLLFTLGIYSIYSAFIIKQSVSLRAATAIYVILIGMGVTSGIVAHYGFKIAAENTHQLALQYFHDAKAAPKPVHTITRNTQQESYPSQVATKSPLAFGELVATNTAEDLTIEKMEYSSNVTPSSAPFTKLSGKDVGLDEPTELSLYKFVMPISHSHGRTISTGDVNQDGWIDVLFVSENGLALYINQGDRQFVKQAITLPSLSNSFVSDAALIDLNNDNWLDIYFTTVTDGDHVIYSQYGAYYENNLVELPHYNKAIMTTKFGFADLDKDGDLDAVRGHWSRGEGVPKYHNSDKSKNFILTNTGSEFEMNEIPGEPGAPIGMLISDFNGDDNIDIIIGNDFEMSDNFYLGDGKGDFVQINKEHDAIEATPQDTMSIVTADIDNDLIPEIFMTNVAQYPDNDENALSIPTEEICNDILDEEEKQGCLEYVHVHRQFFALDQRDDVSQCKNIANDRYRQECVTFFFVREPQKRGGREVCDLIPKHWNEVSTMCYNNSNFAYVPEQEFTDNGIPQKQFRNVLLKSNGNGKFNDYAENVGLEYSGFAWNAKFVDYDNDEWQDLYVANGWVEMKNSRESNYFFQNQQGKSFANKTDEYGLTSYFATSSYSHVDIDNDGDQDIITIPVNAPIQVFINNASKGHALDIELRDQKGNSHGIGSKIIVHYGQEGERHQMRELQASGGFLSHDPAIAHFGLGDHKNISRIEVHWSTGETDVVEGNFQAGSRYRITRNNNSLPGTSIVSN